MQMVWTDKAEKSFEIAIPIKLFRGCYPAIISVPAAQTVKTRACCMVL